MKPYTVVFLTRPKPGMPLEEFLDHYQNVHRPLVERMPGLVSYRQSRIRHTGYRSEDAVEYDALSEYVFADEESARATWDSPEGRAVDEDTGAFIDWPSVLTVPVEALGMYQP